MRVCVQWTRDTVADWVEVDSTAWASTASKTVPVGGESIDNVNGWIYALCVQAVVFTGFDHYHVDHVDSETCVVSAWNDDEDDWPSQKHARVWTFKTLAPDSALGNAINTRQTQVRYAEPGANMEGALPWEDFTPPTTNVRHGVWTSDAKALEHDAARAAVSWRSWTEGLDSSELDESGLLKSQRAQGRYKVPDGTVTYFINNPTRTGVHTIASGNARSLDLIQGTPQLMFGGNLGINSDALYAQHTTIATEPGFAQWGTGDYRAQIEVSAAGAGLTFGYTTAGGSSGHFGRINAAASADIETKQQVEALASGTGIKLFTTGSVSWGAGAVGDRFEILLACARDGVGHGNQSMNMNQGDADAFADGPFDGAAAVEDRTVFFGANF